MAFKKPKKQPEFADLVGILAQSKDTDNALYQTVQEIINRLSRFSGLTQEELEKKQDKTTTPGFGPQLVVREVPLGALDGVNTIYVLASLPVVGSEQVYLNGLLQDTRGIDYNISGKVITFILPPLSTDRILVTYQR